MPPGTTLGLKAKLGVETDDQQVKQETRSLKDKITDAAEAEMSVDIGTLKEDISLAIEKASEESKLLPDLELGEHEDIATGNMRINEQAEALGIASEMNTQLGRPGGGRGSEDGSPGAGAMAGEMLSGMKGAGGKFLKVGLAGAVGLGILSKVADLSDSSPRMMKTLDMISRSISLFARPFFDALAKKIEPMATALLTYAAEFNKYYADEGLKVALAKTTRDVVTKNGEAGPLESAGRLVGGTGGFVGGAAAGGYYGAQAGGTIGTAFGPAGTVAGAAIGGTFGALLGGFLGLKTGGAAGSIGDSIIGMLKDKWPGWSELIDAPDLASILAFGGWKGNIIDPFVGWIKSSPGIIDQFPGWGEWLDELEWPVPDDVDIEGKISPLEWPVPGLSDITGWVKDSISDLDWPLPGLSDFKGWLKGAISVIEWPLPGLSDVKGWLKDAIVVIDWAIPSLSNTKTWIKDAIPDLEWNLPTASDVEDIIDDTVTNPFGDDNGESDETDSSDRNDQSGDGADPGRGRNGANPELEPMATGGLVTSPTEAVVGEAGPEVVAPFNKFMQALNAPDRRFGRNGGRTGRAGRSDVNAEDIVDALKDIKKRLDRLDPEVELKLDRRTLAKEEQKGRNRYRDSKVVTR